MCGGRPMLQAPLALFGTAADLAVSPKKARKNKLKPLIAVVMAGVFLSAPALAQEKNEVGLVIAALDTE
jgi:hypothetical protein